VELKKLNLFFVLATKKLKPRRWKWRFQSRSLLIGGVADADERLVESKLLEWLRSGAASWCGGRGGLLLKCGDIDCCVFVEDPAA
jgi:hypothetical protein